ncbi:MAG: HIT domain-containing protein [Candidatus Omnitrophota bacterium]
MKRLWAPWRIKYIQRKIENKGCIFCQAYKSKQDRKNYVVYRNKSSFSILNIFPYVNGHVMVVPNRHVKDIDLLNQEELMDLLEVLRISKQQLDKTLKPHGYNIGLNIGSAAGAGFDKHLHIHIVPRWKGDANFMPFICDTKVVSQSLKDLYNILINEQKNRHRKKRR